MAFPEAQPSSILSRFGDAVKKYFSKSSDVDKIQPLGHNQAQEESLMHFLHGQEKVLWNMEFSSISKLDFTKCVNSIYHIYGQLHCRRTCHGAVLDSSLWITPTLAKVLTYILYTTNLLSKQCLCGSVVQIFLLIHHFVTM